MLCIDDLTASMEVKSRISPFPFFSKLISTSFQTIKFAIVYPLIYYPLSLANTVAAPVTLLPTVHPAVESIILVV